MERIAGRYRLEREIGSGGIGTVYHAIDERTDTAVAVKVIGLSTFPAQLSDDLSDWAVTLVQLRHPNLVTIHDCIVEDTRILVVMELVEGVSLWQRVYGGARLRDLRSIFSQAAAGLSYLHQRDIVHGDIKASNIMVVPDGRVKLLDFELVVPGLLLGGAFLGTPAYMSPEQRAGRPLDERSDLFSLGAALKFAVGEYMPADTSVAIETGAPVQPPPGWGVPVVRAAWTHLIARAMAIDVVYRYQTASEMRRAIESLPVPAPTAPLAATRETASLSIGEARPAPEMPSEPPTRMAGPEGVPSAMPVPSSPMRDRDLLPPVASAPDLVPEPPATEWPRAAASGSEEPRTVWEVPSRSVLAGSASGQIPESSPRGVGAAPAGSMGQAPGTADTIEMSAYYPKEVAAGEWYPLYAYVFVPSAAAAVAQDAMEELGSQFQRYRKRGETGSQKVVRGTLLTATPRIEGFLINPPTLSIGFFEDVHRLDFRLRSTSHELDRAFNGVLTFTVEGIIIADIPVSIYVGTEVDEEEPIQPITSTHSPYDAIFCSYSHADEAIVRRVERAYRALGMEFLRDLTTLKSGQQWNEELLRMIDRSDIFQLFWSPNAAKSEYVAREWQHAVQSGRNLSSFIRPVYWRQPMPAPPPELAQLHFAYDAGLHEELEPARRRGWVPWSRS